MVLFSASSLLKEKWSLVSSLASYRTPFLEEEILYDIFENP